jgi:hypothetical protein
VIGGTPEGATLGVPWLGEIWHGLLVGRRRIPPRHSRLARYLESRGAADGSELTALDHEANELTAHDYAAGNRLHAAALCDLARCSYDEIAEFCGYGGTGRVDGDVSDDSVRRAIRQGRALWKRIGALPWVAFRSPTGLPPRRWHDPDEAWHRSLEGRRTDEWFQLWETGRLHAPEPLRQEAA